MCFNTHTMPIVHSCVTIVGMDSSLNLSSIFLDIGGVPCWWIQLKKMVALLDSKQKTQWNIALLVPCILQLNICFRCSGGDFIRFQSFLKILRVSKPITFWVSQIQEKTPNNHRCFCSPCCHHFKRWFLLDYDKPFLNLRSWWFVNQPIENVGEALPGLLQTLICLRWFLTDFYHGIHHHFSPPFGRRFLGHFFHRHLKQNNST